MKTSEPERIDLSAALGLRGSDAPTTALLERLGYTIKSAPGKTSSLIGEGAFAEVYYAEHKTSWQGAIKVFKSQSDAAEFFRNETEALEKPHFPKDFAPSSRGSWHEPPARPFIVLEYIRGTSIDDHVKKPGLPHEQRPCCSHSLPVACSDCTTSAGRTATSTPTTSSSLRTGTCD